ncbi:MAG TPA: potassium-transporting ATPase subunit KdpC [Sphingomonas sp.]|nr:potassium-transporting ATPase subunit KdpC [Sphingomonas sp.]
MKSDFLSSLRPAVVMTLLFAVLLGVLYPLALTGIGQLVFPAQSNGSIVRNAKGQAIGSTLIGQGFAGAGYFHGRPSAAGKGYDGLASSGSNLGPASKALVDRVNADIAALRKDGVTGPLPADSVTASGSGLDPDISPATAYLQAARVAKARGLKENQVRTLVDGNIEKAMGFLGEDRVNVLALNLALDRMAGRAH